MQTAYEDGLASLSIGCCTLRESLQQGFGVGLYKMSVDVWLAVSPAVPLVCQQQLLLRFWRCRQFGNAVRASWAAALCDGLPAAAGLSATVLRHGGRAPLHGGPVVPGSIKVAQVLSGDELWRSIGNGGLHLAPGGC